MSSGDFTHGIDHDLAKKREAANAGISEKAEECRNWINSLGIGTQVGSDFQGDLKSGVVLCEVINKLKPGSVKKINRGKMPFVQRENIANYLDACQKQFGMASVDLFVTKDLFENYNMMQVVLNIYSLSALSRKVGFQGPFIGTKQADKNERNFSEEVLNRGKSAPTRQTVGSFGYQPSLDKSMDKIKRLDESASKSHGGVSRQVQGSFGYQPEKEKKIDKIKRLDESQSRSYGGVSRQVQGSFGYQPEKETKTDKILRHNQSLGAGSTVPSRQTQGSYGYQDSSDKRGVDSIVRNVDELQADRAKAKNR